jgi:hypothetical protein
LTTCATLATDDPVRWAEIEKQAHLLVADAERAVAQPDDLATVHTQAESFAEVLGARRRGGAPPVNQSAPPSSTTMHAPT